MGKITVKGEFNSTVQFAYKIQVDAELWNARSQRCMGKSHVAIATDREIESLLVLLRVRLNDLKDVRNTVTAADVKNAFQGIAATSRKENKAYDSFFPKIEENQTVRYLPRRNLYRKEFCLRNVFGHNRKGRCVICGSIKYSLGRIAVGVKRKRRLL